MDMRANMPSMNGANTFTARLFQDSQAVQQKSLRQLDSSINEINARAQAMQQAGKGQHVNISV